MINSDKKIETIEDLIFDRDFIELSKRNNSLEIETFLSLHADKKDIVYTALTLLQYIHVELQDVSDEQIQEDWSLIQQKIESRKRRSKKARFYIGSAIAACAIVLFLIFLRPFSIQPEVNEKENLSSLLNTAKDNSKEIQIIVGSQKSDVANGQTIEQGEDGSVIIGEDKKIDITDASDEYLTIVVPKGRRTTIKFSDGTMAWVNASSKIVYPKRFKENNREIIVDGEIYLNVAKDINKPFIIHTMKGFDIKVLGTELNINAYNGDKDNSVVLVNGSVEVIAGKSKGILKPNQGFFINEDASYSIRSVDVYSYISWKDDVLKLTGESLDIILKKLSRHYGVDIIFDEKYTNEKYIGKIDLKEPIETVLSNISISTPLDYTRNGDIIIIK